MKKLIQVYGSILVAIFLLYSCGPSLRVTHDYDKNVNFQNFKTFQMMEVDAQHQSISQLNQARIMNAIRAEMIKKGFTESTTPDLKVNPVVILEARQSITANTNWYGYGGWYRPYTWGGGMSSSFTTFNVQNYKDGSLIIGVIDAKSGNLIWEGIGNRSIDRPLSDPDKTINDAVSRIMANFPPSSSR